MREDTVYIVAAVLIPAFSFAIICAVCCLACQSGRKGSQQFHSGDVSSHHVDISQPQPVIRTATDKGTGRKKHDSQHPHHSNHNNSSSSGWSSSANTGAVIFANSFDVGGGNGGVSDIGGGGGALGESSGGFSGGCDNGGSGFSGGGCDSGGGFTSSF